MRTHRLIVCILTLTLILMFLTNIAKGQEYFEYNVQLRSDGSALWMITQFSPANASAETWERFSQKVFDLVDSAQTMTHRDMTVDESSLQINTTISAESKITEYSFVWRNFSVMSGNKLSFGDVFQVNGFFTQLFGDAALELSYPLNYGVESVYPPPYDRQDASYTLKWVRTTDLASAKVNVVLTLQQNAGNAAPPQYDFVVLVVLVVAISVSVPAFYSYRRRERDAKKASELPTVPLVLDTEEDKIIKLLKTSGGVMRQSEITEHSKFSKAKTSQLLSALENSGKLTRYKKGRDKIVTIKERVKEE
jgi:uncharacterized membrane protein